MCLNFKMLCSHGILTVYNSVNASRPVSVWPTVSKLSKPATEASAVPRLPTTASRIRWAHRIKEKKKEKRKTDSILSATREHTRLEEVTLGTMQLSARRHRLSLIRMG